MVVLAILGSLMLNRTPFGRWLYASGGNERAAELSGVPVKTVQVAVYMMSGVCAADRGADPVLAADLGRADGRHHLRTDRHRGRRHRRRGADRRARQHPRHAARRLRDRLPVRRPRDHRHLVLLADGVHRRRHRARGAAQRRPVPPPRQAPAPRRRHPPLPRRPRREDPPAIRPTEDRRSIGIQRNPREIRHVHQGEAPGRHGPRARAPGLSRATSASAGGPHLDHRQRPVEPLLADGRQRRRRRSARSSATPRPSAPRRATPTPRAT